jgi:hypothetical protein
VHQLGASAVAPQDGEQARDNGNHRHHLRAHALDGAGDALASPR